MCFLAVIRFGACFHFLTLTLYPSHFCHLHLCPGLSFNLSIVFGSFWLAYRFLQVSSLVTKIKDLTRKPGLYLRFCLLRSSAAVSVTALFKLVTMGSSSAPSFTSVARRANLPPIVAWKALITVGSFSFSRSNDPVQPECPALVFDQLANAVPCSTHQFHCHHSWMLVHIPE